jgi:hypothetical protein
MKRLQRLRRARKMLSSTDRTPQVELADDPRTHRYRLIRLTL